MKCLIIAACICLLISCRSSNAYRVVEITAGNAVRLENGVIVELLGVQQIPENILILERYTKGDILLYDADNQEINQLSGDRIKAVIYNAEGDCVNDLLRGISGITDSSRSDQPGKTTNNPQVTVVKMKLEGGVYVVPISINGEPLFFIFDTGASLISISKSEAQNLFRQGKLSNEDIIGKSQFVDANGDISQGTIINLKSVEVGNRILKDVKACVLNGQSAPLLLGQSALQKFGKISIDYTNLEITFE